MWEKVKSTKVEKYRESGRTTARPSDFLSPRPQRCASPPTNQRGNIHNLYSWKRSDVTVTYYHSSLSFLVACTWVVITFRCYLTTFTHPTTPPNTPPDHPRTPPAADSHFQINVVSDCREPCCLQLWQITTSSFSVLSFSRSRSESHTHFTSNWEITVTCRVAAESSSFLV